MKKEMMDDEREMLESELKLRKERCFDIINRIRDKEMYRESFPDRFFIRVNSDYLQ